MIRIAIIADWLNPTIEHAIHLLSDRGARVTLLFPERALIDLATVRVEHDLYILKSGTDLALSLAGSLHALGARTLNPYPTVAAMRNKIVVTRTLQAAEVPTPETYVATNPNDLVPLLTAGPLVVKPYRGSRGVGVRVVRRAEDLTEVPTTEPILAQRYYQPDGPDHKIYCIGGPLFGVKRIWPIRTYQDKLGEPFTPWAELGEIARRCGQAFGIDLYGLDVVVSNGRPYVVDVNKFGSYMGVPDGPRLLADYLYGAGERASRGEPVLPVIRGEAR